MSEALWTAPFDGEPVEVTTPEHALELIRQYHQPTEPVEEWLEEEFRLPQICRVCHDWDRHDAELWPCGTYLLAGGKP